MGAVDFHSRLLRFPRGGGDEDAFEAHSHSTESNGNNCLVRKAEAAVDFSFIDDLAGSENGLNQQFGEVYLSIE
ncbi:hypothetical protein SD77_1556 [Bacillus badius]|uniref:Uncharacterized protein n=3 Tax=Bacillus badius TaxID=1455 RepID=A0ABR5AT05_BACBA|nr:hypothetical protein SD77_1556 [Bacillus badius]